MSLMQRPRLIVTVLLLIALGILSISLKPFGGGNASALRNYETETDDGPPAFPIVQRAARSIRESQGPPGMIAFLTTHVQKYPDDRNNGYYLTVVADTYQEQGAPPLARQYYRRALLSYPDITIRSVPVHRVAINRLLDLVENPDERIFYLRYLQRHYSDEIDWGLTAYYLGKAYEAEARWSEAYESYRVFLRFPETRVPGEPDAHQVIRRQLAFYDSDRNWTYEDLDELVGNIKHALWAQSPALLLRNRAGKNFFTMSWEQERDDANSEIPTFDIAVFLRRSRVRFAEDLDISSNANEAFLRTSGWSHRIPTWYLYFRRIDFPADPTIHGNWEWAGIYFGESM